MLCNARSGRLLRCCSVEGHARLVAHACCCAVRAALGSAWLCSFSGGCVWPPAAGRRGGGRTAGYPPLLRLVWLRGCLGGRLVGGTYPFAFFLTSGDNDPVAAAARVTRCWLLGRVCVAATCRGDVARRGLCLRGLPDDDDDDGCTPRAALLTLAPMYVRDARGCATLLRVVPASWVLAANPAALGPVGRQAGGCARLHVSVLALCATLAVRCAVSPPHCGPAAEGQTSWHPCVLCCARSTDKPDELRSHPALDVCCVCRWLPWRLW